MGFMDKIQFWKKEGFSGKGVGNADLKDPFSGTGSFEPERFSGFNSSDPFNTGVPSSFSQHDKDNTQMQGFDSGFSQDNPDAPQAFSQLNRYHAETPQPQPLTSPNIEKDIELISVKLDNLKNLIESMNQRLINIENNSRQKQDPWR